MTDWTKVIRAISPHADADIVAMIADHADEQFAKHEINTSRRQAHLLAHMSVESGGFTTLHENLNYSAKRLTQVWPHRFPTIAAAEPYAHNPKALALKTYGERMGNRPGTDDGWKFAGAGLLQTTGRFNGTKLGKALGIDADEVPQWLVDPEHALECAVANFIMNGAIPYADHDNIEGSTKAVNGGLNGLSDREAALRRAYIALKQFGGATTHVSPDAMTSAQVKAVQTRLKELDFFPGTIDGDFGPLTRSAVRDFQDAQGLKTTGNLDAQTLSRLDAATTPKKVMPTERENTTVEDLRKDGSTTIAAADDVTKALNKSGAAVGGILATAATYNDQLKQAKGIVNDNTDILTWLLNHWQLPVTLICVVIGGYFVLQAHQAAEQVKLARLADHQSGAHLGR